MKKLRIYTDTSVIGGCFDDEFAPWSKGLFEDFRLGLFRPVLSEVLAAEIEPAPDYITAKYAELLSYDPEFIQIDTESTRVAEAYLNHGILDARFSRDLLHIALATVAEADIVASCPEGTASPEL